MLDNDILTRESPGSA